MDIFIFSILSVIHTSHLSIFPNYHQAYSIIVPSWYNYNTPLHVPLIPFSIILDSSLSRSMSLSRSDYLPSFPLTLSGSQILKIEIWRMVLLEALIQGYHSHSNEDTPLAQRSARTTYTHSSVWESEWVLHSLYLSSCFHFIQLLTLIWPVVWYYLKKEGGVYI